MTKHAKNSNHLQAVDSPTTIAVKVPPVPPAIPSHVDDAIKWGDKASKCKTPRAGEYKDIGNRVHRH
jgi:hypothetical protein